MIPSESFERELRCISPNLRVRWEHWRPDGPDGTVPVWPMVGVPYRTPPEALPASGRFVIFSMARGFRKDLFDVVRQDGFPLPLDRRVLRGVRIRDRARRTDEDMSHAMLMAQKLKRERASRMPEDVKEVMEDRLTAFYREKTGLRPMAIGTPEAPAAPKTGTFVVHDRRRFAEKYALE
jgi:hypothetical protein